MAEAQYNRALVLAELGEDARAVADLRALREIGHPLADQLPGLLDLHAQATVSIGVDRFEARDYQAAVQFFTRSAVFAPTNPVPYNNLGLALQALGDEHAAQRDFRTAEDLGWSGDHVIFDTAAREGGGGA